MHDYLVAALAGLSIGFLGSFHCLGMCGPIALALPIPQQEKGKGVLGIAAYNVGRAVTYGMLGLLFGYVGLRFRIWGLQQAITITAGGLILMFVLTRFNLSTRLPGVHRLNTRINQGLGRLLQKPKKASSLFLIGLLNGLLPCGLVYVGMAAAMATVDVASGGFLMFAFGIGTMPMMAGLMLFGSRISLAARKKINRAVPYLVGLMAILLILRGLNLGIPYISPKLEKQPTENPHCH